MANSVNLGNKMKSFVTRLVASGRYNSKSEVLREGVRLIEEREARLAVLNVALARGIADADTGRVILASKLFGQLRKKYSAMSEKAGNDETRHHRRGEGRSRRHR